MAKATLDIWEANKTITEFSTINKERVEGLSNLVNYFKLSTTTMLRRAKLDSPVVKRQCYCLQKMSWIVL